MGAGVAHDTDLIGFVTVRLAVTAPDGANVHARLLDVGPDGAAHLIAKGQARVSAQPTVVDLLSIAYRLKAGHALALDLMSSDFPDFIPEE